MQNACCENCFNAVFDFQLQSFIENIPPPTLHDSERTFNDVSCFAMSSIESFFRGIGHFERCNYRNRVQATCITTVTEEVIGLCRIITTFENITVFQNLKRVIYYLFNKNCIYRFHLLDCRALNQEILQKCRWTSICCQQQLGTGSSRTAYSSGTRRVSLPGKVFWCGFHL